MKLTIVLGLFAIFFTLPDAEAQRSSLLLLNPNCPEPPPPPESVELECDASQSDGTYVACDECRYICPPGTVTPNGEQSIVIKCEPRLFNDDKNCCSMEMAWTDNEVVCIPNLPTECTNPPFWDEVPPGDIAGWADCDPLSNETDTIYPVGYECTYVCPEGFVLVGIPETVCTIVDEEQTLTGFSPASPCCRRDCFSVKRDILFILDWSTTVDATEWEQEKNFTVDMINALWERNQNLVFGVEVFGGTVQEKLTISFQKNSADLRRDIRILPFNGVQTGTWIVGALDYATNTMFGSNMGQTEGENVVFFVTDGACTNPRRGGKLCFKDPIEREARELQLVTSDVIAVGIGLNPDSSSAAQQLANFTLHEIASRPENVQNIDDFAALEGSIEKLTELSCSDSCLNFEQRD